MSERVESGPSPVRALSVVGIESLPAARVMAASLRTHEPGWTIELVLLAAEQVAARVRDAFPEGVTVTTLEDALDVEIEETLARHHDLGELSTLVTAAVLERRLREAPGPVVHIPATAWVLGGLGGWIAPLDDAAGVVLSPRMTGTVPDDGREPVPRTLLRLGRIAPDLIALGASPDAEAFAAWWLERCETMYGELSGAQFGLRAEHHPWLWRSLELALTRPGVTAVRDPGVGRSAWNLHDVELREDGGRAVLGQDVSLSLVDLAGFSPDAPWRLHPRLARTRVRRGSPLACLLERYAAELRAAGWTDVTHGAAVGQTMDEGITYDQTLQRLATIALSSGLEAGDPLTAAGAAALVDWLRSPAPRGGSQGVNRYLYHRVLSERVDVVRVYPDLEGEDARGLLAWAESSGRRELEIPEPLMGPAHPPAGVLPGARAQDVPAAADAGPGGSQPLAVRVSGYMGHVLGLGAAARGYATALEATGVDLSTASLSLDHLQRPLTHDADYGRHLHDDLVGDGAHGAELICVNPDELPLFVEMFGRRFFRGRRIGVWGWETTSIPKRWAPAFDFIDEIWVYSRFVADSLSAATEKPVIALPPPVVPPAAELSPLRLGVPDGFLFLFVFDYSSTIQRKNPVGVIRAFQRAFAEGEGPQLLVKTINAPRHPLAEDEVLWATEDRRDIHVIDRSLNGAERDGLMLGCDCYVSLHRSEGFGLTMAEAMAVGKPVIATGYSGNVDFMTSANSYLVEYEVTRVGADVQIYPADGEWAEPSVEHAAALMREVYENPEAALVKGAWAREDIARELSPAATGAAMVTRLHEILG